ncbi:MAG TPA: cupin domain-containing protein [Eudoraea sp.]|nr:cupin domain-containing protein [Eudoraea sp.]
MNRQNLIDTAKEFNPYKNLLVENVNESCLRLSVNCGLYDWHVHENSDEYFIVLEGELKIEITDSRSFLLAPFDCLKMPKGVIHRTESKARTVNLVYERQDAETKFLRGIKKQNVNYDFNIKNLKDLGNKISDDYKNFVLEKINEEVIRLGINTGTYDWHLHPNSDELFIGVDGSFQIETGEAITSISSLDIFKIPKGTPHKTSTRQRKVSVTFERATCITELLKYP